MTNATRRLDAAGVAMWRSCIASSRQRTEIPRAARFGRSCRGIGALAVQPEIGRPVAEMPREFRGWSSSFGDGGYVTLYRYRRNGGDPGRKPREEGWPAFPTP